MTRREQTAAEFMAELEKELEKDEEYLRRRAEREAARAAFRAELDRAEQPLVADLAAHGVEVESVWDLVNRPNDYEQVLPVLLAHLRDGDYPERIRAGIARSLATPQSNPWWEDLRSLYVSRRGPEEEMGLAAALAASATEDRVEDLIALALDDSLSDDRVMLIKAIRRYGGERGMRFVESVVDHDLLGYEARNELKKVAAIERRRQARKRKRDA